VEAYFVGWVILAFVFALAQARFHDAHQAVHGLWRPRLETMRTTLFPTPAEIRARLRAASQPDDDPTVERARQNYLLFGAVALVYLLLAIPIALATGG
jgi:hypothetical protein